MFDVWGDISWLAIALSTIAYSVLGAVWFALLFRVPYVAALGKDPSQKPEMSPIFYLGPCCVSWSRASRARC